MFVVASEVLPTAVRGVGMGLSIFFFWLMLFVTEISFLSMWQAMTVPGLTHAAVLLTSTWNSPPIMFWCLQCPGTFAFYACMTAIVLVFVYLFVPETKQKSLEEIAESFRLKRRGIKDKRKIFGSSTQCPLSSDALQSTPKPVEISPTLFGRQSSVEIYPVCSNN
eukprot:GHVQ01014121.1.p1 GENE.GHVQ01014121.1~~GHVQ01014121.1.p1  ORF type:complete len:165 (+),score=14.40 GHVQ01014121.1:1-495(+)